MKDLIKHLVSENWPEITKKALCNCHALGVDSIVLLESPGKTIRLFIANRHHNLWRNDGMHPLSVAYHPHHCNITIAPIAGVITNYSPNKGLGRYLGKYIYQSPIITGSIDGTFKFDHYISVANTDLRTPLVIGDSLFLRANALHTIHVDEGVSAAWFVFEGREDPEYKPVAYSNHDLTQVSMSGYYTPMSSDKIKEHLYTLGLL